jgi:hypothetical protein
MGGRPETGMRGRLRPNKQQEETHDAKAHDRCGVGRVTRVSDDLGCGVGYYK